MDGDRGKTLKSCDTCPQTLRVQWQKRVLNEAAAWVRNVISVVPCSRAALWNTSLQPVGVQLLTSCAVTAVPAKEAARAADHGYARWVCSGGWARGHGQGKELWVWDSAGLCSGAGNGAKQERDKMAPLSQTRSLGPGIEFWTRKRCWGYELAACFTSLLFPYVRGPARNFSRRFWARKRVSVGQTGALAMPCCSWGELELVGNPIILPARAFIRTKGSYTGVGMWEVTS